MMPTGTSTFWDVALLYTPRLVAKIELVEAPPVQQAIPHSHVDAEPWRVFQPFDTTGLQRRYQQALACDGHGAGVDIYAIDGVQRALHQGALRRGGFSSTPPVQKAMERSQ
jgi:hypothetical protein